MKKILIIDCDGLAWSTFHALPPLSHNEQGTAIIYGFLNHLFDIQKFEQADKIVFAWDSRESKRIELFPAYKLKRRNKKKEYTTEEKQLHVDRIVQFNLLREIILPSLGFSNVFQEEGFEGDDIIASISQKYSKKDFVKIVARDGDLFQLINTNCSMFDTVKRQTIDEEDFFNKYSIYPDMWAEVKSLCGCTTDEVPGIQGIGEDRAIKYLLGNMKVSSVLYKRIESSKNIIELTKKLVVLPFIGTPKYKLKKDKCKPKKLKKIAHKYGLESYLSQERVDQFRRYFCNGNKKKTSGENGQRVEAGDKNVPY